MAKKIILKKPSQTEMCPPGFHVVKGHYRKTKSGKTWVDTHIRENPGNSKNTTYLSENLLNLYWRDQKTFPKLSIIKGFAPYHEIDNVIQFWLDFWNSKFKKFEGMDPLLVKAIIAVESSFNPLADPKVSHSSAYGLMQITDSARKAMTGEIESSVTQDYIKVSRKDLEDPVVNIAVGIRWLIVKYFNAYRRKGDKIHNMIKIYYGRKEDKLNEKYLKKVLNYYNTSIPPKSSSK